MAIHCGGWDQINGGEPTHAWRMLTGCKYQYTFSNEGHGYECFGSFNPNKNEWEPLENAYHKCRSVMWPMKWPELGGGRCHWLQVWPKGDVPAYVCVGCPELYDGIGNSPGFQFKKLQWHRRWPCLHLAHLFEQRCRLWAGPCESAQSLGSR